MDKYSFLLRSNTASPLVVMCACIVLTSSQFTSNSISFSDMNSSCCVVLTSIAAISLYQVVTRGLPPRYWNNCRPSFACATHSNRVRWCRAPCSVHIHKRVVDHSVMYEWKQITCLVNGTLVAILNIFNIDSSSTTNFEARQSLIVVFIFFVFCFCFKASVIRDAIEFTSFVGDFVHVCYYSTGWVRGILQMEANHLRTVAIGYIEFNLTANNYQTGKFRDTKKWM